MRIVSLAVRAWKGLERAELTELAPDLNLVVGPNESEKSRLVTALRYALFERYKGESEDKKALRTYGGVEPPSVEVRFEARGTIWTVKKQFLRQAYARLEGGGRTWTDDDAEAMLRDLLGTKPIQGRREVDQFLGLWPLLWVRQGEGGNAPQSHMNDDARARLRDVLASQIDLVAAGPLGERIVARAERERERYLTATGKETGELAAARARHAEAESALAQATAKRAEAHGAADELSTMERELAGIDARIAPQRARVVDAAARAARAKEIAAKLRAHEADAARRRAEGELSERALAQREELAERGERPCDGALRSARRWQERRRREGSSWRARGRRRPGPRGRTQRSRRPTPSTSARGGACTSTRRRGESGRRASAWRAPRGTRRGSPSSARSSRRRGSTSRRSIDSAARARRSPERAPRWRRRRRRCACTPRAIWSSTESASRRGRSAPGPATPPRGSSSRGSAPSRCAPAAPISTRDARRSRRRGTRWRASSNGSTPRAWPRRRSASRAGPGSPRS